MLPAVGVGEGESEGSEIMALAQVGEWRGRKVEVTARLIPRCLWTTASIDVFIDSECVLQTGGQMKSIGASIARFYDSGSTCEIELKWGRSDVRGFPIKIVIDGELVPESRVFVENWPVGLWPLVLLAAAAVGVVWWLR